MTRTNHIEPWSAANQQKAWQLFMLVFGAKPASLDSAAAFTSSFDNI